MAAAIVTSLRSRQGEQGQQRQQGEMEDEWATILARYQAELADTARWMRVYQLNKRGKTFVMVELIT